MRTREERGDTYESKTLSVANGTTNYDVHNTGGMFANDNVFGFMTLKSDKAITIKLNATTGDSISIDANIWYEFDHIILSNFFITNASGFLATIYVIMDENI